MDTLHHRFVDDRFEGSVIRTLNGIYKHGGGRSNDLLKRKDFFQEEFEIVQIIPSETKKNQARSVELLLNKQGDTFRANLPFDRDTVWKHKTSYIGRMATVKFQEIEKKKPRFAVIVGFL